MDSEHFEMFTQNQVLHTDVMFTLKCTSHFCSFESFSNVVASKKDVDMCFFETFVMI